MDMIKQISNSTVPWNELVDQLEDDEISFAPSILEAYSSDRWLVSHRPDAVAFPKSVASIQKIVKFAQAYRIPVTPRGGGHGYVGGCVPILGGIVLSLERMNRIIEINKNDFVVVAEAGVITAELQRAVEAHGLFYPPDPASRSECTIGGNIATNAGGPRCLKYGVTRDYVLGLQIVTADGEVLELGGRTHKNKTGFELTRLFVGSEGMLGIVTKAVLKLLPLPPTRAAIVAGYDSATAAAQAIQNVFARGILPAALEVADAFTLEAARKKTGRTELEGCGALVITEVDGQEVAVRHELGLVESALQVPGLLFSRTAFGPEACEELWAIRREFSNALRETGLKKLNEDIVVPRSRLVDLLELTSNLRDTFGIPVACFGHAGDGNIHTNIMVNESDPSQLERANELLDSLFRKVLEWGGAITGEHGIGLAKKRWWPVAVSPVVIEWHRRIKRLFDPVGILNPGKFLDD